MLSVRVLDGLDVCWRGGGGSNEQCFFRMALCVVICSLQETRRDRAVHTGKG